MKKIMSTLVVSLLASQLMAQITKKAPPPPAAKTSAIVGDQRHQTRIDRLNLLERQAHVAEILRHEHRGHANGHDRQAGADEADRRGQ